MDSLGIKADSNEYKNKISDIIQVELIDLYGANGYKSIMQTMTKVSGKTENEIITNFELFSELSEGVFGKLSESKILDQIKMKINVIGMKNIHQEEKTEKKSMRMLIADDEIEILGHQKIIFASGYLEKALLEVLTKLDKAIAVIEKPFSLEALDYMINNSEIFDKLEKININQKEKDVNEKMIEIMAVLQNPI